MPGLIQSAYFPGVQHPQNANLKYDTRWYVIGNDSPDRQKVLIRLIHDYMGRPEKDEDEEYPGQFCHQNFSYDCEWDYPRGVSTNLHGTRVSLPARGNTTKSHNNFRPNGAVSRIRIGMPDRAFFPYDSHCPQKRARELINCAENKRRVANGTKGKKATTTKADLLATSGVVDDFGDLKLPLLPVDQIPPLTNGDPSHSRTWTERLDSGGPYAWLLEVIQQHILDLKGNHREQFFDAHPAHVLGNLVNGLSNHTIPKASGAITDLVWHDLMVTVLQADRDLGLNLIPEPVRQELLFGIYEASIVPDQDAMNARTKQFEDDYARGLHDFIFNNPPGRNHQLVPPKKKVDHTIINKTIYVRRALPLWNQRKRFLYWGMRYVLEAGFDAIKNRMIELGDFNLSRREYSNYWGDYSYTVQLQDLNANPPAFPNITQREFHHPHRVDIVVIKKPAKKRKADDITQ